MSFCLFSSLFVFTTVPNNITSILLILYIVSLILMYKFQGSNQMSLHSWKLVLANLSFVIVLIFTIAFSSNKYEGLKRINTLLPLLLLPIASTYLQPTYTKKQIKSIAWIFIISNVIFLVYQVIFLTKFSVQNCYQEISALSFFQKIPYLMNEPYTTLLWCSERGNESKILIHKTYNSIGYLICLLACMFLFKGERRGIKMILVLLFAVFSSTLFYIKSITGLVLLFTVIPFYFLTTQFNFKKSLLIYLLLLIVLTLSTQQKIRSYLSDQINNGFVNTEVKDLNGINERIKINLVSYELYRKSPYIGYGIGDVQDKLNEAYLSRSNEDLFSTFFEKKLNTHNYYFNLLLAGGPLLLLLFIISIVLNMRLAIKTENKLFMAYLLVIVVNLFIENLFNRMNGVMMYALGLSLFLNHLLPLKSKVNA
jgi:O-antigen ligase